MAVGDIKAGSAFVTFGTDLTEFQKGTLKVTRTMDGIGRKAQQVGRSMLLLGSSATAAFALAVRAGVAFENEMANVLAITGAATAEFTRLNDTARELGRTTTFTATEAARGMKLLSKAGFDTNEVIATIPSTLALARVGALELGQASDIIAGVSKAFGLTADEAGRVADVIGVAANASSTNVDGLAESLKFVAAQASLVGLTVEQTSTAIGLLGDRMLRGGIGGRNLARALQKLGDAGVQSELGKLGVDIIDPLTDKFRDIIDIFQDIGKATENLRVDQRLDLFTQLFDVQGGRAALAIATSTTDQIDKLRGKVNNATGSISRMQKVVEDTTGGGFKLLISAVNDFGIAIKEILDDDLKEFSEDLKEMATGAVEFAEANPNLVRSLAAVSVAVLAAGVALTALGLAVTTVSVSLVVFIAASRAALFTPIGLAILGIAAALVVVADAALEGKLGVLSFINDVDVGFFTLGENIVLMTTKLERFFTVLTGGSTKKLDDFKDLIENRATQRDAAKDQPKETPFSKFNETLIKLNRVEDSVVRKRSVNPKLLNSLRKELDDQFKKLKDDEKDISIRRRRKGIINQRRDVFPEGKFTGKLQDIRGDNPLDKADLFSRFIKDLATIDTISKSVSKTFSLSDASTIDGDKSARDLLIAEVTKQKLRDEIEDLAKAISQSSDQIKVSGELASSASVSDFQSKLSQDIKDGLTPGVSAAFDEFLSGDLGTASKRSPTDFPSASSSQSKIEELQSKTTSDIAKIALGGGSVNDFLGSDIIKKRDAQIKAEEENIKRQEPKAEVGTPRSIIQGSFSGLGARGSAQLPMVKEQKETNRLLQQAVDAIVAQRQGLL